MTDRFCDWLYRRRWLLLAGWVVHAFVLHLFVLGFTSWDGLGYRTAPIVELVQHGALGTDKYFDYAFAGYVPFVELAHTPFAFVFGLPGFLVGFPLVVFPLCVCAVYGFARELTGTTRGAVIGALAYAALPMYNAEPFGGYVDFAICGALAFYLFAVLRLRSSPGGWRSFAVVVLASFAFTMSRAQALYVVVLLAPVACYAAFCERTGWRIRFARRRALAITAAGTLVGAIPTIAIQLVKLARYGSPTFPLQFQVLGWKLGTGLTLADYMHYAGLPDDSWASQGHAFVQGWLLHRGWPCGFFDSRFMGAGLVSWLAIALAAVFVRRASRVERWLVPAFLAVSLLAHDFVHPRWAYTLALALVAVVARGLPALASGGRAARIAFWIGASVLVLHMARPEFDIVQVRAGAFMPRLNVMRSRYFLKDGLAIQPMPDLDAHFVIVQRPGNGYLLPLYGKHLTNDVIGTRFQWELGPHCEGLVPLVHIWPNTLYIDDDDLTKACARECVVPTRGGCRAYRLLP
ncbi:MAG TPA: hypothetical protein VLX92_23115 [Kofleriaceae bacterium]|nr:hypothetical protein [Kofleriaceae bacterium]